MGEMAKYAIKTGLAVVIGAAILIALTTFFSWITSGITNPVGIVAECISFALLYLPINASGLNVLLDGFAVVIAFYVAWRIYLFSKSAQEMAS